MEMTLLAGIHAGTVNIDDLTDEQQEQVLRDYQILAEHWAEHEAGKFGDLGKAILLLLEESSLEIAELDEALGKTSH
jgi:hypothetical protein